MAVLVDQLLRRKSLAAKIGQLNHPHAGADTTGAGRAAVDIETHIRRGEVGALTVEIELHNSGVLVGDEIVQLYVADPVASRSRPLRELKAFQRVTIQLGETHSFAFRITPTDLNFVRAQMLTTVQTVCEPGAFRMEVGASSQTLRAAEIEWREA